MSIKNHTELRNRELLMFKDQVIWITGASSGIGEALALEFAKRGAKLILSSRNEDSLRAVAQKCEAISCGANASYVLPMDVTDEDGLPAKVEQAKVHFGQIDLLINNAGISQRSSFLVTDMATYRKLFEVDVFGQIALTKLVVPIMLQQGNGHVAVTASVAGKIGVPFRTGYCAAKHAVMGFFDALRSELAHQNIRVTTITPGYIHTNISANAVSGDGTAFGKTDSSIAGGMSASECARIVVNGLQAGKPEIAVGKGIEMHTLWIKRLFPKMLFKLMQTQFHKIQKAEGFK
jgi:dehydrogenase/reductase SDR family protein 7